MDRTTRRVFGAALLLLVVVGLGIALLGGRPGGQGRPDSPFVDGVVVRIEATGLAAVSGFTLRSDAGRTLAFTLKGLSNGTAFPPGHLSEHQATSSRVRVLYTDPGGGTLDALWLEDAPAR